MGLREDLCARSNHGQGGMWGKGGVGTIPGDDLSRLVGLETLLGHADVDLPKTWSEGVESGLEAQSLQIWAGVGRTYWPMKAKPTRAHSRTHPKCQSWLMPLKEGKCGVAE